MANCAFLTIGSLVLAETYEGIDPDVMKLFRPSDRHIRQIDSSDRDAIAEYIRDEEIDDFDENNPLTCIEYRCSVQVAKDRLDLKGFTREIAEGVFMKELPSAIQAFAERENRYNHPPADHEEQLAALRSLTLEDWLAAMQEIREGNLSRMSLLNVISGDIEQPILRYMLGYAQGAYGFPGDDVRPFIRLAIDDIPSEDELVYDLTDLTLGDHWESADDVRESADFIISEAEFLMQSEFLLTHRVIVLTEGKSDIEFLERSLRILYPHLADYFHFFNFAGMKEEPRTSFVLFRPSQLQTSDIESLLCSTMIPVQGRR